MVLIINYIVIRFAKKVACHRRHRKCQSFKFFLRRNIIINDNDLK